jgi:CelD/BcsL family acetyltransferase involved in cellulose biosynthesis
MKITVVRPDDLGTNELDLWHEFQAATPSLTSPFLAPDFAVTVGRVRPRSRVAVLADGAAIVGFFPFERSPLGVGLPIAPGLNDCQGLIHTPGLEWDPRQLLRACRLADWEFDHLIEGQLPFARYQTARHASPLMDLTGGFEAYRTQVKEKWSRAVHKTQSLSELPRKDRKISREVGTLRFEVECHDLAVLRTLMSWKSDQYRRSGTYDRFARGWIVELLHELLATRSPAFAGNLEALYSGDELVAANFSMRADWLLASWFSAYSRAFGKYSPGALLRWRSAEVAATNGIRQISLGRGPEGYKLMFKNADQFVFEGQVTRRSAMSAAGWARRVSSRRLHEIVVGSPQLYRLADPIRKQCSRVDSTVRHRLSRSSSRSRDWQQVLGRRAGPR